MRTNRTMLALTGVMAGLSSTLVPATAQAAPAPAAAPAALDGAAQPDGPALVNGTCGDVFRVKATHQRRVAARAYWQVTCSGGRVHIKGWLDDVSADGRCAYLRVTFADRVELLKNCPHDSPRKEFNMSGPGRVVDGELFTR